jgi:hypothetical protein
VQALDALIFLNATCSVFYLPVFDKRAGQKKQPAGLKPAG